MDPQQLSSKAKKVVDALKALPPTELAKVVAIASAELATKIAGVVENSTPAKRAKASAKVVEGVAAATKPQKTAPVSEIKKINGHIAVVGQITFKGRQLDTLLSEGSFNKSRVSQQRYARKVGGDRPYRMADREESRAYVEGLLAKEDNNTIKDAENKALQTYRLRYVRDTAGGLDVEGRRVYDRGRRDIDVDYPGCGALFVRASAESK